MDEHLNDLYPLSSTQSRIWFVDQLDQKSHINNLPYIVRMEGEVRYEHLIRSFQSLMQRHELLRTVFCTRDGIPYQKVLKDVRLDLSIDKLPIISKEDEAKNIAEYVEAKIKQRIDLEQSPLFRIGLLQIAPNKHLLVMIIHHIIADGWSIGIMLRDLIAIYDALCKAESAALPDIGQSYREYVVQQRKVMEETGYEKERKFWCEKLKDCTFCIDLPYDYPIQGSISFDGALELFSLPLSTSQWISDLSLQYRTTPFTVLLACFYIFLFQHTKQQDLPISVPVASRDKKAMEQTVGPYVNTLLFRQQLDPSISFIDFLKRIRNDSLDLYEYSNYPYEELINDCFPRNYSQNPMALPVMFSMQTYSMPLRSLPGLALEMEYPHYADAPTGLSLTVWPSNSTYQCSFEYNTSLWKRTTILRMIDRFVSLIERVSIDATHPISFYECITQCEKKMILKQWSETADMPIGSSIHGMFRDQAGKTPDNIAIIYDDREITYRQLDEDSDLVSGFLRDKGIEEGDVVGLYLPLSYELVVAIFAVLKCGACYLSFDVDEPDSSMQYMIEDSRPALLITDRTVSVSSFDAMLSISEMMSEGRRRGCANVALQVTAGPACIIYTSGSTGHPKGVILEHSGICNIIESFIHSYETTSCDRVLPITSVATSSFVGEVFSILCCGGALVLMRKALLLDHEMLWSLIKRQCVSIISTVPSMLAQLNNMAEIPASLRILLSGGETLQGSVVDKISKRVTVVNGYGLTETSICNTYHIIRDGKCESDENISIGSPIANNQVYILDEYGHVAPIGTFGQIYVAGKGLARGYLNHPELTAEKFVTNPFDPGSLMFATGDRARWTENGTIEYAARYDHQIKIRGYRVETEEIEKSIEKHPHIKQCLVKYQKDAEVLCAFLVMDQHAPLYRDEFHIWLRDHLPAHMRPSKLYTIPFVPPLPNGKKNRNVPLENAVPIQSIRPIGQAFSPVEKTIFGIFADLVGHADFSASDNFFDIGGHSLLLMQLQSRIQHQFGIQLSLERLLRQTSVRSLSLLLCNDEQPEQKAWPDESERRRHQNRLRQIRDRRR